jgi:putative multiple sugar transport system ATP-binding protein
MVDAALKGEEVPINNTTTYDNGVKVVPSYLLVPHSVDISNWRRTADRQRLLHRRSDRVTRVESGCAGTTCTAAFLYLACVKQGNQTMSDIILEMRNITKTFPGVKALDNVNLSVQRGEIHALVGENGAGKSTLMKVLSGVYPDGTYTGQIFYEGQERHFKDISHSEKVGIVIIHQELALIPMLSIKENIFLGNERARRGVIDWNEATRRTQELLEKVGLHESPNTLITDIGVGKQQLVEIAKALAKEVRLLILDEPTASLNESDSDALLQLLLQFKAQGISSILISHKLGEVSRVADSITILRDGATIETLDCRKDVITEDRIIRGMVGRDMTHRFPPREHNIGETIFEIKDWTVLSPGARGPQSCGQCQPARAAR